MKTTRTPAFYLLKSGADSALYWQAHVGWMSRQHATRFSKRGGDGGVDQARGSMGGLVVPVHLTIRKVRRGHSWAWACKQMVAGKKVRRSEWDASIAYYELQGCMSSQPSGTLIIDRHDVEGTDWVLVP